MSTINEFSKDLTAAVEKGGARGTVTVDARQRYPASGLAFAADLGFDRRSCGDARRGAERQRPRDGKDISGHDRGPRPRFGSTASAAREKALTPVKTAELPGEGRAARVGLGTTRATPGFEASWGIVTAIGGPTRTGREGLLDAYIQTETTSYPGFSGGPLVNTEGEVLGLNTSGLTRVGALTIPVQPLGASRRRRRSTAP